jgi:conjugal transfer pilus assembly protein TraU
LRRQLFCAAIFATSIICTDVMAECSGHFINPITDICWSCLFPMSIGGATVMSGSNPDTENPSSPLQLCPMTVGWRIGLAIGYWEPFATTDVTRAPYCLVNLGGVQLNVTGSSHDGASESSQSGTEGSFYQVHWYKYPLIMWLNIITSITCMQTGDYDIGYLSELDPSWDDDELGFLLSPEASLFSNPVAQLSCATDAVSSFIGAAKNQLFWCMGAQGSSYPLTGNISSDYSTLQNSTLLSERMDFKLHREGLVEDSSGENGAVCHEAYTPIMPKNRYRYELMNPVSDSNSCHTFGHTVAIWGLKMLKPNDNGNYGYLIWRKRNCVFL